jgi:hypothetical protein
MISRSFLAADQSPGYGRSDRSTSPEMKPKVVKVGDRRQTKLRAKRSSYMPATKDAARTAAGLTVSTPTFAKMMTLVKYGTCNCRARKSWGRDSKDCESTEYCANINLGGSMRVHLNSAFKTSVRLLAATLFLAHDCTRSPKVQHIST